METRRRGEGKTAKVSKIKYAREGFAVNRAPIAATKSAAKQLSLSSVGGPANSTEQNIRALIIELRMAHAAEI